MKGNKKITSLILVLALMIAGILGGTLAYWQWITSTEQETLVNVSLTDDATIYIDFPENEITNMYPTSDCEANGTSSWVTDITVNNGTGVLLATKFKLKVKIEDKNGQPITNTTNEWNAHDLKYYVKYAVTEENESCKNALYTGRFDSNVLTYSNVVDEDDPHYSEKDRWYDSGLITIDGTDGFPIVSSRIGSGVSFHALPNRETSHRYKVWVWLDEEYKSVTVGNDSTMDKLQDAKVTVSWSENSELEQVKQTQTPQGEAIAIYSADDESLRFYREENPSSVTVGSTYNGRTVHGKFTGFENGSNPWGLATYYLGDVMPDETVCNSSNGYWDANNDYCYLSLDVKKIIFEDYIYPRSTVYWFMDLYSIDYMDVTKLDTSNTTNMSWMFGDTRIKKIIGLENWDTSNVINMDYMISIDNIGNKIDLSGWNVCNVTDYESFVSEEYIENESIIRPYFGNPEKCNGGNPEPNYDPRAGEAYAVYSIDDGSLRFYRSETPIVKGEQYNGREVTWVWTDIESETFVASGPGSWKFMEYEIDEVMPDGTICANYGYGYCEYWWSVEKIIFEDYVYPISTTDWFGYLENGSSDVNLIDVTKLDVSNVINMSSMFESFSGEIVGLETWNTSNVTNMDYMFIDASINNEIDLSGWNVCNVESHEDFGLDGMDSMLLPNWGMSCP